MLFAQILTGAAIGFFLIAGPVPAPAQWFNYPTPGIPRTSDGKANLSAPAPKAYDGKPDLSGIWQIRRPRTIPEGTGSYASLQYFMTGGAEIPFQPWAEALFKQRYASFGAGRPSERCQPHGIPDAMLVDLFKIVQYPQLTIILYEEFKLFRQIFTDGRTLPSKPNPAWLGYSIGKWDGDGFAVDTAGFNDKTWLDDGGHPHTDALHTVERFHRRDFGHMDLEVTIDDPKAYTRPWSFDLHFELVPDTELIEFICDNEKDSQHIAGK